MNVRENSNKQVTTDGTSLTPRKKSDNYVGYKMRFFAQGMMPATIDPMISTLGGSGLEEALVKIVAQKCLIEREDIIDAIRLNVLKAVDTTAAIGNSCPDQHRRFAAICLEASSYTGPNLQ